MLINQEKKIRGSKWWEEYYAATKRGVEEQIREDEAKRLRQEEQARKQEEAKQQRQPIESVWGSSWKDFDLFGDQEDEDFNKMYGMQPYQMKKQKPVDQPAAAPPFTKNVSWLDDDSDEEDFFQTGLYRQSRNIFEPQETPEEKQRRKEKEKAQREQQKKLEEQRRLEKEQERLRQQEKERKEKELRLEAEKQKEKNFVDDLVRNRKPTFQVLTEEQRNSLGKFQRSAYDKRIENFKKNIEHQKKLAVEMFQLKERAELVYKKIDFSKSRYTDHIDGMPAEAEVESFRLEDNKTLLYGEPELFMRDLQKLSEQNRGSIAELDRLTQQYQKYAEELKNMKIEQGFSVPKVKEEEDFFANLGQINQYLRTDKKDKTMLNSLMRKSAEITKDSLSPIGKQMVVHKSLSQKEWEDMTGKQLSKADNVVGYRYDSFKDKCFCRASIGEEAPNDVQLVIAVSKDIRAMRVSGIEKGGKDGLLLLPETDYHIIKQERLSNGKLRVYVSASN
ncbi:MAG: hypothetical protein Q4C06_04300 [Bacillota bacterium]|nr:hypothetical protein [Bacillota bacterium]